MRHMKNKRVPCPPAARLAIAKNMREGRSRLLHGVAGIPPPFLHLPTYLLHNRYEALEVERMKM